MVELVAVMAILGILVGIAVPTFSSVQRRADEARSQSTLRTASKAAFVDAVESDRFDDSEATLAALEAIEPSLSFVDGATSSTGHRVISIAEDAGGLELALAVRASTGNCVYLRLSRVTLESRHSDDVAECRGADYVDGPNTGW